MERQVTNFRVTNKMTLPVNTNLATINGQSLIELRESVNINTYSPPADGDYGDITVSGGGTTWTIDPLVVTTGKIANSAITAGKIDALAVTNAKINDVAATKVTEDVTHRFVTDAQILAWNAMIGGSIFQTTWNASTNSPTLTSSVGTKGYYYIVATAGSTNLDGITDWKIGDWAIFDGTVWRKVDNTDAVSSVNSLTGAVLLDTSNVPDTTNKRYVTDANLVVINNTSGTNTGNETVNTIGALINGASAATPNDADLVGTADASVLKKITWTNVKAFLKTYFDTIYQAVSGKDATGGYAGLTLFKINFKNAANTFTSFFTNSNTAARTYTFQDRDGTIADDTDLALKAPLASPTFTGTGITITPTALTGASTTSAFSLTQQWNTSGSPTLVFANVNPHTTSGSSSKLIDLQVAGVSQFNVTKAGLINTIGGMTSNGGTVIALNANITANGGTASIALNTSNSTITSGTYNGLELGRGFAPTSGTGVFNTANFNPTINQTGGASGKSRAIYINPTLTAAADFTGIELTNTTGKSIVTGTAPSTFGGTINAVTISASNSITTIAGGIGYTTGAGGTVVQATSRTTGVTLDKLCGLIQMFSAAQLADEVVTFTFTNSNISDDDFVIVEHAQTGATGGAWAFSVDVNTGNCTISVRNVSGGSITQATLLRFFVLKAADS